MKAILQNEAKSTTLSLAVAQMLVLMRGTLPEINVRYLAAQIDPNILKFELRAPTDFDFGWCAIKWQGTLLVLVQGLTNAALTKKYADAWDEPIAYGRGAGVNSFLWDFSISLNEMLSSRGFYPASRLILVGHSAGGAAVQAYARLLLEAQQLGNASVITFGSPCAGPQTFTQSISSLDLCRWMVDVDPVPCIPPRQSQSPRVYSVLSNETALNWNRMVQPHGGFSLNEIGGAFPRENTQFELLDVQTSIVNWLVQMATNQINAHSMPTYVSRLTTRLATYGEMRVGPRPTTHAGKAVEVDARELEAARATEVKRVLDTYEAQAGAVLVIPQVYRFKAHKIGQQWVVIWMDSTVAIVPGKRKARDIARSGNTLLNRLQRCAGISTESLQNSLNNYLLAAADDGAGFSPVMKLN